MKILVTGSAGHLGEALMRTLRTGPHAGLHEAVGMDARRSPFTDRVGSIVDRAFVARCMAGVDAVLHTATLHKPHVATHGRQEFVDTNVTGTLNLLEEAALAGAGSFIYTSTTSTFGLALSPAAGLPAAWITEDVVPVPKNIYGVTKLAAENLCELFARRAAPACIVLRTSRFFPEADDDESARLGFVDANLKANELLHRRVDIEDVVEAHLLAMRRAPALGFGRYIISATTPFTVDDLSDLRAAAPAVLTRRMPGVESEYQKRGWKMPPSIDRVYVNELARHRLGWRPRYDFQHVVECLRASRDHRSPLALEIGFKGYHDDRCGD